LLLVMTASGVASASFAAGVKGSPQPELKPFLIGTSNSSGGAVAIEPDGSLVVVYGVSGGNGKTRVCVLARGKAACSHTTTLTPLSNDDTFGAPQVFIPSRNHVEALQGACCDANPLGGDVMYSSTNGGVSFGAPVRVGSIGVASAMLLGSHIVFAGTDGNRPNVESLPVGASGPSPTATLPQTEVTTVALGHYRGGVLVASASLFSDYSTSVEYAPAADSSNFGVASSYKKVATFNHEDLLAMSGDALLTIQTTGKNLFEVRFFNGTSFGAAHAVPGLKEHTLGAWETIDQDPAGVTHVFVETNWTSPIYTLEEASTANGSDWTGWTDLGNAISSTYFYAGLDCIGSGLVLGDGGSKAIGYPVLAPQSVTFALSQTSIKRGHSTIGRGKGSKAAAGRTIELQIAKGSLWYNVASTHESSSGAFSFTIKGSTVGTAHYRAVASDLAGYVQYGYSPARTLTVTS